MNGRKAVGHRVRQCWRREHRPFWLAPLNQLLWHIHRSSSILFCAMVLLNLLAGVVPSSDRNMLEQELRKKVASNDTTSSEEEELTREILSLFDYEERWPSDAENGTVSSRMANATNATTGTAHAGPPLLSSINATIFENATEGPQPPPEVQFNLDAPPVGFELNWTIGEGEKEPEIPIGAAATTVSQPLPNELTLAEEESPRGTTAAESAQIETTPPQLSNSTQTGAIPKNPLWSDSETATTASIIGSVQNGGTATATLGGSKLEKADFASNHSSSTPETTPSLVTEKTTNNDNGWTTAETGGTMAAETEQLHENSSTETTVGLRNDDMAATNGTETALNNESSAATSLVALNTSSITPTAADDVENSTATSETMVTASTSGETAEATNATAGPSVTETTTTGRGTTIGSSSIDIGREQTTTPDPDTVQSNGTNAAIEAIGAVSSTTSGPEMTENATTTTNAEGINGSTEEVGTTEKVGAEGQTSAGEDIQTVLVELKRRLEQRIGIEGAEIVELREYQKHLQHILANVEGALTKWPDTAAIPAPQQHSDFPKSKRLIAISSSLPRRNSALFLARKSAIAASVSSNLDDIRKSPTHPTTAPPSTDESPPPATSTTTQQQQKGQESTPPTPTNGEQLVPNAQPTSAETSNSEEANNPRKTGYFRAESFSVKYLPFNPVRNRTAEECKHLSQDELVNELKQKGTYNPELMAWDVSGVFRFLDKTITDQYERQYKPPKSSEQAVRRNVEALERLLAELNLHCDVRSPDLVSRLGNLTLAEPKRSIISPSLRLKDQIMRHKRSTVLAEQLVQQRLFNVSWRREEPPTPMGVRYKKKQKLIGDVHVVPFGCDKRGGSEDGYLRLCGACQAIRKLPDEFFPPFINEVMCDDDKACLYFYDYPHGKCKQKHMNFVVLRNVGTQVCQVWEKFNLNVRVSCECFVDEMSFFSKYV